MNIDGLTPHELRDGVIADHNFYIYLQQIRASRSLHPAAATVRPFEKR
jgi:hypothetical protein